MPTDRIWAANATLELSHFTACRVFPLHLHAAAILAVIVDGAETICVDGRRELAEAGSIVVLDPEQAHLNQPMSPSGARYRGFYLESTLVGGVGERGHLARNVVHDPPLAAMLVELHRALELESSAASVAEAEGVVAQLLDRLPRSGRSVRASREVEHVAQILRNRCAERLAWADLARDVDVSAAQLARRFRAERGIPPHLYQTQFRVTRAKRLIQRFIPLATVAFDCGFADQSHLTHQFTRYVGQTPGAFARAQDFTRR